MKLSNLFHTIRCPSCSYEANPYDCAIVSSITQQVLQPPPKGVWQTAKARLSPIRLDGPFYTQQLALRQCPRCGNPFDSYNIESVDNYTIAVVGASFSGKSHYIAAVVQQFKQAQGTLRYKRLTSVGTTEKDYQDNFFTPLFVKKEIIPINLPSYDPIHRPLTFQMIVEDKKAKTPGALKSVNIRFYDASGEDMVNPASLVQYNQYLLNPSAIIFLADPTTMPGIVGQIPFHLRPSALPARQASEVLHGVLGLIERNQSKDAGVGLSIPITITLSKSDLLKYVDGPNQPYQFLSNPGYSSHFLAKDLQAVSQQAYGLISQFGDPGLVQLINQYHAAPFAVSATGCSDNGKGHFPDVTPIRCLDPLIYVLWRLGVIEIA